MNAKELRKSIVLIWTEFEKHLLFGYDGPPKNQSVRMQYLPDIVWMHPLRLNPQCNNLERLDL